MMKETVFITAFILGFNLAVGQLNWSCNDEVDGCWIYLKCTTNVNLNLSSLTCDLDGRRYHACERERTPTYDLIVKFEANLASANDRRSHRMVISIRGVYSGSNFTIPWAFRFRVDHVHCPLSSGGVTPQPATTEPTTQGTTEITTQPTTQGTTEITTQPTTQGTTELVTQPTTQRTTELVTQPTTQGTAAPTTMVRPGSQTTTPTTQPAAQPTTQTTTQVTIPTTTNQQQSPYPAICNPARNSAGDLFVSCTSDKTISNISYEVNGQLISTTNGSMVTIANSIFRDGSNTVVLVISYSDGSHYVYRLTYEIRRTTAPTPTPIPCRLRCTGRYTSTTGLTVTCTVNSVGVGIHSIAYNVNNGRQRAASSIPTFVIGPEHFQTGQNKIVVTINHNVCGQGKVTLPLIIPEPPSVCPISCTYGDVDDRRNFDCSVGNGGQFLTVQYSINGVSLRNIIAVTPGSTRAIFHIPFSELTSGIRNTLRVVYNIHCGSQSQQFERNYYMTYTLPSFQVTPRGCNPSPERSNPSFSLSLNIYAHSDSVAEYVGVQPYNSTQRVILWFWSLGVHPPTNSQTGPVLNIPKTNFSPGRNNLNLIIYGVLVDRISTTCTLDVQW